jgi:hypothetical protein
MFSITGVTKSNEPIRLHSACKEQYEFQDRGITFSHRNYSSILIRKILILGNQHYTLDGQFDFGWYPLNMLIAMAEWSKVWICGRSAAGTARSNLAGSMNICL